MNRAKAIISSHEVEQGSYRSYITGFVLSLILTLSAYIMVVNHLVSNKWAFTILLGGLALIQCVIQLILFLHLGRDANPKLRLVVFGFMMMVIVILISGSIWIMYNLNNRMMTPKQINTYMQNQDDGGL